MSWHCSQALAAAFSGASSSGGNASARSNTNPPQDGCSPRVKMTDASNPSPSGTTLEPSMESHGVDWWMSSLAASRAKTYPPQEKERDSMASEAVSGLKCLGSLARFDLDSRSWKTHQFSLLGGLESFSETWPRWGMMRGGECWELSPPAHLISEIESGSLPTPRATDGDKGSRTAQGAAKEWERGRNKDLGMVVAMWPTPQAHKTTRSGEIVNADGTPWDGIRKPHSKTSGRPITTALADAVAMWGTPRASDGMKNKLRTISSDHDCRARLEDQVAQVEGAGGHLNPTWVEWLMGWPLGWTDSAQSATDRFRQWCASHGNS